MSMKSAVVSNYAHLEIFQQISEFPTLNSYCGDEIKMTGDITFVDWC